MAKRVKPVYFGGSGQIRHNHGISMVDQWVGGVASRIKNHEDVDFYGGGMLGDIWSWVQNNPACTDPELLDAISTIRVAAGTDVVDRIQHLDRDDPQRGGGCGEVMKLLRDVETLSRTAVCEGEDKSCVQMKVAHSAALCARIPWRKAFCLCLTICLRRRRFTPTESARECVPRKYSKDDPS